MAVDTGEKRSGWSTKTSLEELGQLAKSAGAEVVAKMVQRMPVPTNSFYLGKGKVDELSALKDAHPYNVAIFDEQNRYNGFILHA